MVPVLLILIPLISGLALFAFKSEQASKEFALFSGIVTLGVMLLGVTYWNDAAHLTHQSEWIPALGSSFHLGVDGMGKVLCLLTAISFRLSY